MKGNSPSIDEETAKMVEKTSTSKVMLKKQKDLEEKKKKKGFEFRKRVRLTKKEGKELERTHTNIFDWVKQADMIKEQEDGGEELELLDEDWLEVEMLERMDKLSRKV